MKVKVVSGKVWDGKNTYFPGDVIGDISKKDAAELVKAGNAEYAFSPSGEVESNDETQLDTHEEESGGEDLESENETGTDLKVEFNPNEYVQAGNTGRGKRNGK